MTISITASSCSYTGDGTTVAFEVKDGANGIYFGAASELVVQVDGTTKTLGTHYTVSGAASAAGVVTFLTAPADDAAVTIERETPQTQTLSLTQAGAFDPASIMAAFDKAARIDQDQQRQIDAYDSRITTLEGDITTAISDAEAAALAAIAADVAQVASDASTASTAAGAANTAKLAAEAALAATLAAYDNFDDRYLGEKSSAPTLDNDGNALVGGQLYYDNVSGSMKVYNGSSWAAAYVSAAGALMAANNLSELTDRAAARASLDLEPGTDVQAYDADLSAIAGLTSAADKVPYFTGAGTAALATLTSAGRALIDDADASAQRTTLGLGTAATLDVGTEANKIVQLTAATKLPAVDASLLTNLPSGYVESSAVSIPGSGSPVTFAHGLGVRPKEWGAVAVVTSAWGGYAVGDRIPIDQPGYAGGYPMGLWANTTTVGFNPCSYIYVGNASGTGYSRLDQVSCNLILWARS